MYKICSECGKMHPYNYKCTVGRVYIGGAERKERERKKYEMVKKSSGYTANNYS